MMVCQRSKQCRDARSFIIAPFFKAISLQAILWWEHQDEPVPPGSPVLFFSFSGEEAQLAGNTWHLGTSAPHRVGRDASDVEILHSDVRTGGSRPDGTPNKQVW